MDPKGGPLLIFLILPHTKEREKHHSIMIIQHDSMLLSSKKPIRNLSSVLQNQNPRSWNCSKSLDFDQCIDLINANLVEPECFASTEVSEKICQKEHTHRPEHQICVKLNLRHLCHIIEAALTHYQDHRSQNTHQSRWHSRQTKIQMMANGQYLHPAGRGPRMTYKAINMCCSTVRTGMKHPSSISQVKGRRWHHAPKHTWTALWHRPKPFVPELYALAKTIWP